MIANTSNLGHREFFQSSAWEFDDWDKMYLVQAKNNLSQTCTIIGSIQSEGCRLGPVGNYGSVADIQIEDAKFIFAIGPPTTHQIARHGECLMELYKKGVQCIEDLSHTADNEGQGVRLAREGDRAIFKFCHPIFEKIVSSISFIRTSLLITQKDPPELGANNQ